MAGSDYKHGVNANRVRVYAVFDESALDGIAVMYDLDGCASRDAKINLLVAHLKDLVIKECIRLKKLGQTREETNDGQEQ